ncbi:tyrosine-type recombinase/integrase [Paraburkholderia xenovorans]|uniref:tyrosine-type recombinase/integrase n=1 Tax=Paraburkholderia xenovorans TaxID=36873 RepID=UPI0038BCC024
MKNVFSSAADPLRARGEEYTQRADNLQQASAHWLRHSAGRHMIGRQVDLRLVRDHLGQASLTTTRQYVDIADDRRHHETDEKHHLDW